MYSPSTTSETQTAAHLRKLPGEKSFESIQVAIEEDAAEEHPKMGDEGHVEGLDHHGGGGKMASRVDAPAHVEMRRQREDEE